MTPAQVRAESLASMIAFTQGLAGKVRPEGNHMSVARLRELRAEVAKGGKH